MTFDEPTIVLDQACRPGPSALPGGSGRPAAVGLPGLAEGTELAGEFVGAGYREPPLLVYRADGQVVRLPELLYETVRALDECCRLGDPAAARRPFTDRRRLLASVAGILSARTGREYAAEHVEFLLDKKLAPLGVTTSSDGSEPELFKPQPMLSLTCRMTMLSERSTWFLAGLFTWLFTKPALAAMIPLILGAASWALITQPIAGAVEMTLASPGSILLVVALAIASTGFHEIGHGTACRYGGVRPGVTGCGFYLAWPVFFTDITNTYRMGRGGRLRADFGGVYFNGVFLLGLTALYWALGRPPFLLVAILSTSLEAVQQLLPTLRFDGYYIIADLVGIPDLFKYIGPIIRRVLLRRPDDGRLAALKRWPQTVVTVWVLLVVPVLIGQLSLLAFNFPGIVRSDWTGVRYLAANSMAGGNPVLGVMSATVQILLLLFPLVGMMLIAFRLLRGLVRMILRRLQAAGLLAGPSGVDGDGVDDDYGDDVPGPRHRARRPGMALPVIGAAAAFGVAVILVWTLMPSSSRAGKAADLRPNKIVGAQSSVRPAPVGRTPSVSPSGPSPTEPSSGYPDPGPSHPDSGPSHPDSGSGYPGKGDGRARGLAPAGQSSTEQPSTEQPSTGRAPAGGASVQSPSAPSSSAHWSSAATQQAPATDGGPPSQPASPSPPQSPLQSASQRLSPSSSGSPSPSGSPPSGSRSGSPSGSRSGSPSPSGSPSGSPSAPPRTGAAQAACSAPVAGMLLTIAGLCRK